jgi:hypothetical protein
VGGEGKAGEHLSSESAILVRSPITSTNAESGSWRLPGDRRATVSRMYVRRDGFGLARIAKIAKNAAEDC